MTIWRGLALVVVLAAAVFAWSGGSYSQREYLRLRADTLVARVRLDSLIGEVDSLRPFLDSLASDPVVQERLARERLGMIRPGEIMLILEPVAADSGR